jgi:hypothetical protein
MTISMTAKNKAAQRRQSEPHRPTTAFEGRMLRGTVAIISVLLATAGLAFGNLISPRALSDLQQTADLIVAGTASGNVQAGSGVFSLLVTRVIKGDVTAAGNVIAVNWANKQGGFASPGGVTTAAGAGLWFLQSSSSGWLLIPVVSGDVPMDMTFFPEPAGPVLSAYAYNASAPLTDRIASELCSAIESLNGAYNFQLYALLNGLLGELGSPVVALHYQRMANSSLTQQRILGLSGLVRGGSGAALAVAAPAAASFEAFPLESGILQLGIRDQFRTADDGTISVLGRAAVNSANPASFRESAAHALAAIHTANTLPYLATLLGDSDTNLRVEAVGGMGSFANGLPTQTPGGVASLTYLQLPATSSYKTSATMANFALGSQAIERNASLLSFWRLWWSQNRAALGF